MKILLLNANRAGMGTYYRALYFGRELSRNGHSVCLMTVSNHSRFRAVRSADPSGMAIIECPNFLDEMLPWHASGILDIGLRIVEILCGRYDCIYAFEYQPNVSIPALFCRLFRRFTLLSDWCDWHAGGSYQFGGYRWAHAIDRRFEEFIRHRADHVTTINQELRNRAIAIGIPKERVTLVPEGIDPDFIRPLDRDECRRDLNIPANAVILGTIVDCDAATDLLMLAIRHVAQVIPQAKLMIVGNVSTSVRDRATTTGIEPLLLLPGRVSDPDLPRYLACADVLALPLEDTLVNRGRWPHKLGDMIGAQRPTIVSPGGEFPKLLAARECAFAVPFDAMSYANAMKQILSEPRQAAAVAERGRKLMLEEYNWGSIGRDLSRLVARVSAEHR